MNVKIIDRLANGVTHTEVHLAGYIFTKRDDVWYKRRPVPESLDVPIDWMGSQVLLEVLEALAQ